MQLKIEYTILITLGFCFTACDADHKMPPSSETSHLEQSLSTDLEDEEVLLINASGDTVPTATYFPVQGKRIDPNSLSPPRTYRFTGKTDSVVAHSNIRPVGEPLVNPIPKPLRKIVPGSKGVPQPEETLVRFKLVPALLSPPVAVPPLPFKPEATASIQYLSHEYWPTTSNVYAIYEDSRGMMWFGSGDGVSRYDGTSITHYTPREGLSGEDIWAIEEDSRGNLWFGTSQGGVTRFDGSTFAHLTTREGLSGDWAHSILEDRKGNLWFGTERGVCRYTPNVEQNGGRMVNFTTDHGLTGNQVYAIEEDSQGNIWFGTEFGVSCYSPDEDGERGGFTNYTYLEGLVNNQVRVLFEDSEKNIWIGTQFGLSCFNGQNFINFTTGTGLISDRIWSIQEDDFGNLWFGTSKGAIRYDPGPRGIRGTEAGSFTHYTPEEGLSGKLVAAMLKDSRGNLWFGLLPGGVNRYNKTQFTYYSENNGLMSPVIRSIAKDRQGDLWIGSLGIGLVRYVTPVDDQRAAQFIQYSREQEFIVNGSRSIMPDSRGNLWVINGAGVHNPVLYEPASPEGGRGGTLKHLSRRSGLSGRHTNCTLEDQRGTIWIGTNHGISIWSPPPDNIWNQKDMVRLTTAEGLPADKIEYLLEDSRGLIWMGTDRGVSCFEREPDRNVLSGQLIHFTTREGLGSNHVLRIWEDSQGNLWFGADRGLSRMDHSHFTGKRLRQLNDSLQYFTAFDTENGLAGLSVRTMLEDSRNHIWFGTDQGLSRYLDPAGKHKRSPKALSFTSYKIGEIPAPNIVRSIVEDQQQRIWASTKKGIMLLIPAKNQASPATSDPYQLYTFTGSNGLKHTGFMRPHAFQEQFNQIWWSTNNGLVRLNLNEFEPPHQAPNVHLNTVEIQQERLDFRQLSDSAYRAQLPFKERLTESFDSIPAYSNYPINWTLPHDLNHLTFHFSAIDWQAPDALRYQYLLVGLDDDWSQPTAENKADYRKLPPGKYTFKVRAIGAAQVWSPEFSYNFRILPPWWLSWPAYLLYSGGLILLFFHLFRFMLERRLKLAEARQQEAWNQQKIRLYTDITHEFRTPLTIILGMVRQIRENPKRWYGEGLQMIHRNGRQLLRLVNQMLDLNQMDQGKLTLRPQRGEMIGFLQYLIQSFESYGAGENIQLHFFKDIDQLEMDFDPDQLSKVIGNLLSNAIKFTPENGQILVTARLVPKPKTFQIPETWKVLNLLEIAVKDNGPGIPPEDLPYIFDRFYQSDTSPTRRAGGSGLGLALTKELIELMGGTIQVKSTQGTGSVFKLRLPVTQSARPNPEIDNGPEAAQPALRPELSPSVAVLPQKRRAVKKPANAPSDAELPVLLLIEDNHDVLTYLTSCLEGHYQLEFATNGREGIEQALDIVPDLIITDVMMPEKDGYELCALLKEDIRTSHIPIVLLTAKADQNDKLEGLKAGADAYLAKPFDKAELEIRLLKLLQLRRDLQTHYARVLLEEDGEAGSSSKENRFLKKLRTVILDHLDDEGFGIAQLCREIQLSRGQLHNKLKALTGQSTSIFIRSVRLESAKTLLRETHLNISEIAYRVGFRTPLYFTQTFTETEGMSPSVYRKKFG